jgi:hypothetical protein
MTPQEIADALAGLIDEGKVHAHFDPNRKLDPARPGNNLMLRPVSPQNPPCEYCKVGLPAVTGADVLRDFVENR